VPDPVSAVRELLPPGLTWAPVLVYPLVTILLTAICAAGSVWLAGWSFRRRRPDHWVERARLGWPPRRMAIAWSWVAPTTGALLALRLDCDLCPLPRGAVAALCFAGGWLVTLPLRAAVERRYGPHPVTTPALARSAVTMGLVLFPHLLVWLALAALMPAAWSPLTWLLTAAALLTGVLAFAGGGLRVGRLLGLVRPAPERLERLLARATERVGRRPRAGWVLEVRSANAFAFSWSGDVGVTRGGLQALEDPGLVSVLAHELGHLAESRTVRVMRAAGTFALVPLLLIRPLVASFGWSAPLIVVGLVMALSIALRRVRRAMEVRADAVAHEHEEDPGDYARALESLYRFNGAPPVLHKRGVHPSLFDRMTAAGLEPDYPKPPPPKPARLAVFPPAILLVLGWAGLMVLPPGLAAATLDDRLWAWQEIAMTGGHAEPLGLLADLAWEEGDLLEAVTYGRAAVALAPEDPWHRAGLAWSLATTGACAEAAEQLAAGRRLMAAEPPEFRTAGERLEGAVAAVASCPRPDGP